MLSLFFEILKDYNYVPRVKNKENNNNKNDNLYGAVTRPCRYKGALQATIHWVSLKISESHTAMVDNV